MSKGAIAVAAAALAAAPPGATPLPAQEFSARSGSSVVLGARAQVQYEASSVKGNPATFLLRRAWVTIDGRVNDLVGGRVQFNANGAAVLEAYLELRPSEAFRMQIGQFKRGMSQFWLAANADLPVIERDARVNGVDECPGVGGVCSFGQLTGELGLDTYEPGVLVTGRFAGRRLGYRVTLTNGEGLGRVDVNTAKSASGRLSFYLGESARVSAYAALDETQSFRQGVHRTIGVPAFGAEVEIGTWRSGPHLLVNGLRGRNWLLDDDAVFRAVQAMALWYVPFPEGARLAGWEPMIRFSWADSGSTDPHHARGLVVTPGFMVYAAGRNGISANLDWYRSDERTYWSLKVQAFTFF